MNRPKKLVMLEKSRIVKQDTEELFRNYITTFLNKYLLTNRKRFPMIEKLFGHLLNIIDKLFDFRWRPH